MTDEPRQEQPNRFPRAFWELHDKQGTGGTVEYREWQSAAMVHRALLINEAELLRMVDFSDEVGQRHAATLLANISNGAIEDSDYWGFLFTRLTNYAAASGALIDHVRKLLKGYEGTAFSREADERRAALGGEPAMSFIKDFRNYLLHNAMAPMSIRINMPNDADLDLEALLNVPELRKWSKWSATSKQYLEGRNDLAIIHTLRECRTLREKFYDWLWEQFTGPQHAGIPALRN